MLEKKGYKKLKVWEKAHTLAVEIFTASLDRTCYDRLERLRTEVAVMLAAFRKSVKAKSS